MSSASGARAPPAAARAATAIQPAVRKRKSRLSATQLQRRREHERDQSAIYNLTLDVNDLRQQLRELEERRALHTTRLLLVRRRFQDQAVAAAALFFGVFRSGFRAFSAREDAFLRAHVAPDVRFASSSGMDAFLDQWRRYKLLFQQRVFRVSTIRVVADLSPLDSDGDSDSDGSSSNDGDGALSRRMPPRGCVLECLGEFEAFLTQDAIDVVFSHVSSNTELVQRIVGARIVCPTRTLIHVDERGRIVDYDAHADFFAALSGVQGVDPMDVIYVMAGARISGAGSLVPAPPALMDSASSESAAGSELDASSSCDSHEEGDEDAARSSRKRHSVAYLLS